jgi:hypothetical protein
VLCGRNDITPARTAVTTTAAMYASVEFVKRDIEDCIVSQRMLCEKVAARTAVHLSEPAGVGYPVFMPEVVSAGRSVSCRS